MLIYLYKTQINQGEKEEHKRFRGDPQEVARAGTRGEASQAGWATTLVARAAIGRSRGRRVRGQREEIGKERGCLA